MIGHALKKTSERNTCNYQIEHKTMPWGPNISSVQYGGSKPQFPLKLIN